MNAIKRGFVLICVLLLSIPGNNIFSNDLQASVKVSSFSDATEVRRAIELGFVPISLRDNFRKNITRADFAKMTVCFLAMQYGYQSEYIIRTWYNKDVDFSLSEFMNSYCNTKVNRYGRRFDEEQTEICSYNEVANLNLPNAPFEDLNEICDRDYIEIAYNMGVFNGISQTKFAPNDIVTRQEAATILMRAYMNYGYSCENSNFKSCDYDQIADWAREAVSVMNSWGIMRCQDNDTFMPLEKCTIEQTIIAFLELYENAPVSRKNKNIVPLIDCEAELGDILQGNPAGSAFVTEKKIQREEFVIVYGTWNRRHRKTDHRIYIFYEYGGYRQLTGFVPDIQDILGIKEFQVNFEESFIEFVLEIQDSFCLYNHLDNEKIYDTGLYKLKFNLITGHCIKLEQIR